MSIVQSLYNKVVRNEDITRTEALRLYSQPLAELCTAADEIRKLFCEDNFDICTIFSAKSGNCSENCKFCAQSSHSITSVNTYSLLSDDEIVNQAKKNYEDGAPRYSIVTSGKSLSDIEVDQMCNTIERIRKEVGISVCASFGLLSEHQYRKLKDAGVSRVHNNLETSPQYFPNICTTHTFQDKINAIKAARSVGLTVCSGGIMGLGETVEDRIDMALTLRELKIENIPINILNPVPGTPFENNKILSVCEVRRIIATYRFMIPRGEIRLSGGRGNMHDRGISCFTSGANAAISGQLLTTSGITLKSDLEVIEKLGYKMTCRQKNKLS